MDHSFLENLYFYGPRFVLYFLVVTIWAIYAGYFLPRLIRSLKTSDATVQRQDIRPAQISRQDDMYLHV